MREEQTFTREKENTKSEHTLLFPMWRIILFAGWFGLLTGLAEVIFQVGWRQYYRQSVVHLSPHGLWMTPLAEMVIFTVLGIFLMLFVRFLPRLFTTQVICFVITFLSFFALLLLFPQIRYYVKWILAVGLAVQSSRIISKYQNGIYQIVRRTAPLLLLVVVGFVLFTFIREKSVEEQALAKLPRSSSSSPNVILITLDTVRAENMSLYGYERRTTPQLERIAQESVVFEQAVATSSWTLPTHASLFTGRFYHELGSLGWTKPFKTSYPVLAEELGKRGYESAGFIANIAYCTRTYGLNRGMVHYEDYPVSIGQMILSSTLGQEIANTGFIRKSIGFYQNLNGKSADMINNDFFDWISSREQNRPFFAFLNYFDAHEPLLPPMPFDGEFGPTHTHGNIQFQVTGADFVNKNEWSEGEVAKLRNAYDSSIAYLDDRMGLLLDKLAERGILENTIIIITSDHGEAFGRHGIFGHGNSLYYNTLWVPLLIRYPSRVPKGIRVPQEVSLRDIPATVLDLIGERKDTHPFPGKPLGRFWDKTIENPTSDTNEMILSEITAATWMDDKSPASKGYVKSLVKNRYHYFLNDDGSEELYNLKNDPKEQYNLVRVAEEKKILEEFRTQMKTVTE